MLVYIKWICRSHESLYRSPGTKLCADFRFLYIIFFFFFFLLFLLPFPDACFPFVLIAWRHQTKKILNKFFNPRERTNDVQNGNCKHILIYAWAQCSCMCVCQCLVWILIEYQYVFEESRNFQIVSRAKGIKSCICTHPYSFPVRATTDFDSNFK